MRNQLKRKGERDGDINAIGESLRVTATAAQSHNKPTDPVHKHDMPECI